MDAWILILAISLSFVAGGAISWAVFHGRLSESKSKIDVLLAQNEMQKAAREDDERHHKESLEAQEARFAQTLAKVTAELKVATEDMLKQRQKEFSQSSAENIGQIVGPLKDTIDRMKQAMNDSTMKQTAMSGEMKAGIENMMKMSEAARKSADELARAFRHGNKVQGDWGEAVLDELLQSQGLTRGVHYDVQAVLRDADGRTVRSENGGTLRPDVILHLDQNRDVIIDSKVSLTAFMDYVNASDEQERSRALAAHLVDRKSVV